MAEQQERSVGAIDNRRRNLLLRLAAFFLLAGISYTAYWLLIGRYYESTEDAYVGGNIVRVMPQVTGTVVAINADETGLVRMGEPLILLDDADASVALEQAKAGLAETVRQTSQLFDRASQLRAVVAARETELIQAREDYARRKGALADRSVAEEDAQHAALDVRAAEANLAAANHELAAAVAVVRNTTREHHPTVERAKARLREAYLARLRAVIPSPVTGHVAKRSVQVGQQISPGAPLMAVVPLDQLWVDANFKEDQLVDMRIGQPVKLTADLYGSGVTYHGKVLGIGAGTGSAFALLPPQNAAGNWIKVVQRVPVRVALSSEEMAKYPLRIGLSMRVEVDVHDRRGPVLAAQPARTPLLATRVYQPPTAEIDRLIDRIVRANLAPEAR
ncbi:MAG: HlyD family efflux transporter periplasmic adaptor subunit [Pseudomonadota bacterium]|jgi:membrane fusion protein (multidrug efflux system)